ncbi:hypothetical protein [Psychrobacter sp. PG1]|uniref:hypothetical protein n=1 Tax=unclassified Psychrobacter TaxID=196806 RepID=UPI0018667CAB|nr:hypothetical protein [Psychrobacter sp. PG1]
MKATVIIEYMRSEIIEFECDNEDDMQSKIDEMTNKYDAMDCSQIINELSNVSLEVNILETEK